MHVLVTCKYKKDRINKGGDIISPIISQWGLSVAMETGVLIQSAPKPYAVFPPTPVMLHIKFDQDWPTGLRDIHVWKCGRRWMDEGPLVYYKLTLWAFGSGELKTDLLIIHKPNLTSSHFKTTYKWAMETRGPKSNSPKLLCLSLLPATLMMIQSKMNELAWRHHFPPTPHPSNATHKIWSRLANWPQRYSCLKVWTTTDGRRTIGIL